MIGTALIQELMEDHAFSLHVLSRSAGTYMGVKKYSWDPSSGRIDPEALRGADYIINLAGAGIADQRWTPRRKKVILESRTMSGKLLADAIKQAQAKPKLIINASAIGFYGGDRGEEQLDEHSTPGEDFLAEVTTAWENATEFNGLPNVHLRIGVVLANEGGALPKLMGPIRFGIGSPLGNGKQWMSWIHIHDLVRLIIWCMDNKKTGIFNAVAKDPVRNKDLSGLAAKIAGKPFFMPNVPSFALKLVFGEMASTILGSTYVVPQRLIHENFDYVYPTLTKALENLIKK